jgi:hypothetical protein
MTRLILALPFLAACGHVPVECDVPWPRTCEERRDAGRIDTRGEPVAERPVDASPPTSKPVDDSNGAHSGDKSSDKNADRPKKDRSRDGNGGSSDGNGGKS